MAIAHGADLIEASEAAGGVNRTTVWRWTQRPEFRAMVREAVLRRQAALDLAAAGYADGRTEDLVRELPRATTNAGRTLRIARAFLGSARWVRE